MLKLFIKHEIMSLLKSNRVIWSMLLFLVLFSIFFTIRVDDFQNRLNVYIQDVEQTEKELANAKNYSYLNPRAIKRPFLFSIYHEGLTHSYGNSIDIIFFEEIISSNNLNGKSNLFQIDTTQLDITYLVTFFLSLFILLISYDCINREKINGTLRIVMTWPFKRNLYLLKKIIGVSLFVLIVFSVPYFLSMIFLIFTYSSLLSSGFIFSYFAYWFLIFLYILLLSGMGVLISILSKLPGKSLVIALFVWVFFCIISPMIWTFVTNFMPTKENERLQQNLYSITEKTRGFMKSLPDSLNPNMAGHCMWSGSPNNCYTTFGESSMMSLHRKYTRYLNEQYMPLLRQREEAYSNLGRGSRKFLSMKPYFLFFNPNILLESAASEIGASTFADYLQFLADAKEIRDKLIDQGVREGWLYSNEYFAIYDPKIEGDDLLAMGLDLDNIRPWEETFSFIESHVNKYKMRLPEIARYQQRENNLMQIISRSWGIVLVYLFLIVIVMMCLKISFDKYDIR